MTEAVTDEQARALLKRVALFKSHIGRSVQSIERRFAPHFDPLAFVAGERRWSALIAFLLNPNESHGQRRLFLDSFIKELRLEPALFPDPVKVLVEYSVRTGGKRTGSVDIVVLAAEPPKTALGIEVKFDAADQEAQLARYHEGLKRLLQGTEPTIIYLAQLDKKPSLASIGHLRQGQYQVLPHASGDKASPSLSRSFRRTLGQIEADRVRWFVELMIDALDRQVPGRMPPEEPAAAMLQDVLLEDDQSLQTTLAIESAIGELRLKVTSTVGRLVCEELLKRLNTTDNNWEVSEDSLITSPGEKWAKIGVRNKSWPERFQVAMEKTKQEIKFGISVINGIALTESEGFDVRGWLSTTVGVKSKDRFWIDFDRRQDINWWVDGHLLFVMIRNLSHVEFLKERYFIDIIYRMELLSIELNNFYSSSK